MNNLKLDMKYQERMKKFEKPKRNKEADLRRDNMERMLEDSRRSRVIASIQAKMISGHTFILSPFPQRKCGEHSCRGCTLWGI